MPKISCVFILFSALILNCAQPSTIISFNIRYSNKYDKENSWNDRKQDVIRFIKNYNPDFLGVQEAIKSQVTLLDKSLVSHDYIGIGTRDGLSKGEHTAIFYNTNKFSLVKKEIFWLSQTPTKVSVGWDASMSRTCTYGVFVNKRNKDTLHVFNTHFDHRGRISREKSAQQIVSKIKTLNIQKKSIIVMGDFNSTTAQKSIKTLRTILEDGAEISQKPFIGPKGTFNGFSKNSKPTTWRPDYIFTKNLKVLSYKHIDKKRENNLWLSDHLPVVAEIK